LVLVNGETVEGVIREQSEDRVVLDIGMGAVTFRTSRIDRIERASDAENAVRKDAWRIDYMQISDLPESMQGIAQRYDRLVQTRGHAFKERGRMHAQTERIDQLEQQFQQDLFRYRDVAAELRALSKTSKLDRYNELALEHNELMSRIQTNRAESERSRNAVQEAVRSMIAYSRALVHFEAEFKAEEPTLRDGAGEIATAWLDRASVQLASFENDFVKMEAPTRQGRSGTLLSVSINDARPATFLLDTGASVVTLSGSLARRLGLPYDKAEGVPVALADGSQAEGYPVMLKSVRVGDALANNVPALVMENSPSEGVDGLLGMTFLSYFEILLDGTTGNLVLRRLKGL
jgi:clan AA aspartic protease (TIGR02281 family)